MPTIPSRTTEQRLAALGEANRIRSYRADLKRDLKGGRRYFPALREDPDMQTAHVAEFLLAVPKIGSCKASELMRRCGIPSMKTFKGLSDRQWTALVTLFDSTHAGQAHLRQSAAKTIERAA